MELTVNGQRRRVDPQAEPSLLQVLREQLGLLAAKPGCGEGACGACTVMLDGKPIRSCIRPITDLDHGDVATLEGLLISPATNVWSTVSEAFADIRAFQCGYCTPGMVVAAGALLQSNPNPTEAEIVATMDGNICRCGTYPRIVRAVREAADRLAGNKPKPGEPIAKAARGSTVAGSRPAGWSDALASPPAKPWDLAEPGERDYFERLGDGLVVILTPQEAERVNDGDAWSTEGGAWLHVGSGGCVTAFTGKVDVGQDNRTALELLVAEEMGLTPESVELVMGDTDFCPADIGTFGSRSTPDAGGVLRAVAATACDWLRTRGPNFPAASERAVVYAKGDVGTRDPKTWHVAGNRVEGEKADRRSARSIARGEARFASDTAVEGMLHGRVLRQPAIGGELRSANLEPANAMDGVLAVRDEDFVGVAAGSPVRAEEALAAVNAQWDVAAQPSEAELDEYLRAHPIEEEGWEGQFRHESGNVDRAIAKAATSLAATYTTAYIAHVPLETRAAVAQWKGDRLTV